MKTRSVLDALIEFAELENEKSKKVPEAYFRYNDREYFVTFCCKKLMFECYGWEGMLLCAFVFGHFPENWEFVGWRYAFDSFSTLTVRVLSGAQAQDLIDEFKSQTQELESQLREITNIIKKHEQKEDK